MSIIKIIMIRFARKAVFVISPVLLVILSLQIFLSINFKEEQIRSGINAFFAKKIGKAVKFDTITLYFNGSAVFTNFNMSKSLDFNDNINLLKTSELKVYFSIYELLRGNLEIKGIEADNAEISLNKQSGESYSQFISTVIYGNENNDLPVFEDMKDVYFNISDSRILYKESFGSEVMSVNVSDFQLQCKIKKGLIDYSVEGYLTPRSTSSKEGFLSISGYVGKKNQKLFGKNNLNCKSIDVSYLNSFFKNTGDNKIVSGYIDCNVLSFFFGNTISNDIVMEIDDLNMKKLYSENKYIDSINTSIIMKTEFDVINGSRINIKKYHLFDGDFSLYLSGVYDLISGAMSANFDLNECDLSSVSSHYFADAPVFMSGDVLSSGSFFLDTIHGICDNMKVSVKCNGIRLKGKDRYSWLADQTIQGKADIDNGFMKMNVKCDSEESKYNADIDSYIKSVVPVSSDTSIKIKSELFPYSVLFNICSSAINSVYGKSVIDKNTSIEDGKFLSTAVGEFMNRNDIKLMFSIDKIKIKNKAYINNFELESSIKKGVFSCRLNRAEGYSAKYSMEMNALFNYDYPKFEMSASAAGFDFASFCRDYGIAGIDSAVITSAYTYSVNASKAAHIIDNGITDFKLNIENIGTKGNPYYNKIRKVMTDSGIPSFAEEISNGTIALNYHQTGENGSMQQCSLKSDNLQINIYAQSKFAEGLNGQGSIGITDKTAPYRSIPFKLSGYITDPVLIFEKNKEKKEMSLFNL